jgi:signal transduction histidine kinase/CheY-like chemotaxis protein
MTDKRRIGRRLGRDTKAIADPAPAGLRPADEQEARAVFVERFGSMVLNMPSLLGGGLIGGSLFFVLMLGKIDPLLLACWYVFFLLWHVLGFVMFKRDSSKPLNYEICVQYSREHAVGASVAGLTWGVALAFALFALEPSEQPVIVVILALVAMGSLAGNLPSFTANVGFLSGLMGPIAVASALHPQQRIYIALSGGLVLVLLASLRFSYLQDRSISSSILLRLRNEKLAAELARSNERLAVASAGKTRFIAAANHDLRQPMHAIGLLVSALAGKARSAEELAIIGKIQSSVEAMNALFDAILDVSRLDANAVTPKLQAVALADLLRSVGLHYGPTAEAKGLRLRVARSGAVTHSDPALLARMIGNLVANAIRYTERGKVLVGVRRRPVCFEVQVLDTGSGIPAEKLTDIFREFVQLSNPTHDRSKGLGLGLSIVQRSAELLGHEVGVSSQFGAGSLFYVRVPRLASAPAQATVAAEKTPVTSVVAGAFVAVVDDEQDILDAMELLLRANGCATVCATDGQAIVAALQEHDRQPDLIITDFRISPTETGVDVINRIWQTQQTRVPALIVTGSQSADDVRQAADSGFVVLQKPIVAEKLLATMAELIRMPAPD